MAVRDGHGASLPEQATLRDMVRLAVGEVLAEHDARERPSRKPRVPRWIVVAVLLMAGTAVLAAFGPRNWSRVATVPAELLGTWTTAAPEHAHRGFTIGMHHVTFYTDGAEPSRLPVRSVRSDSDHLGTQYVLEYVLLGEPYEFAFYYSRQLGGVIYFGNHREVGWRRKPGSKGTAAGSGGKTSTTRSGRRVQPSS